MLLMDRFIPRVKLNKCTPCNSKQWHNNSNKTHLAKKVKNNSTTPESSRRSEVYVDKSKFEIFHISLTHFVLNLQFCITWKLDTLRTTTTFINVTAVESIIYLVTKRVLIDELSVIQVNELHRRSCSINKFSSVIAYESLIYRWVCTRCVK